MSILMILIVFVVVGVALWLINSYIPMDAKVKSIMNFAVVGVLIVWLLKAVGFFAYLSQARL
jgi:hypothetical protein